MPILANIRRERFAQEIAKGKTYTEAYEVAGYEPHDGNASKMANHPEIVARIEEIIGKAADKVSLTKEWVIAGLMENAQRALQRQSVTDPDGNVIEYRYEGSVANRALELLGKEMGMFIERRETGNPGEFAAIDSMSGPELLAFLAQKVAAAPSPDDQDETRH